MRFSACKVCIAQRNVISSNVELLYQFLIEPTQNVMARDALASLYVIVSAAWPDDRVRSMHIFL